VSAYRQADTKQAGVRRRRWSVEFKRELVAATLELGSSVASVARQHDINANQLFKWRRELAPAPAPADLVPVEVMPTRSPGSVIEAGLVTGTLDPGQIEIVLSGGVRVRIKGTVDPAAVTAAVAAVMNARRQR
jgi:transposase